MGIDDGNRQGHVGPEAGRQLGSVLDLLHLEITFAKTLRIVLECSIVTPRKSWEQRGAAAYAPRASACPC